MRGLIAALLAGVGILGAAAGITPENSRSAKEKLDPIAAEKLPPGTAVVISQDEINSYLKYDYAAELPAGISQPHFRLEPDRVVGSGLVDFLEWQVQRGASPGRLLRLLLSGRKRVEAACRFTSAGGQGRADVEWARIGGIPLSGETVHFLVEHLVQPRHPAAAVGRPFPLGYKLRQVRVERGRVVLTTQ